MNSVPQVADSVAEPATNELPKTRTKIERTELKHGNVIRFTSFGRKRKYELLVLKAGEQPTVQLIGPRDSSYFEIIGALHSDIHSGVHVNLVGKEEDIHLTSCAIELELLPTRDSEESAPQSVRNYTRRWIESI